MMSEEASPVARVSSLFLIVVFIALALSIASLYLAVEAFTSQQELSAGYFLMIGFVGLGVSLYMLLQIRARALRLTFKTQPVVTTIVCKSCDFKNVREFKRGDYIFKELDDSCPKCKEKMKISSIFREVKEKKDKNLKWL